MTLLAGDLGGTKTLLGLYDEQQRRLCVRRFDSHKSDSLEAMVLAFLEDPEVRAHPRPNKAAFGVAGPVETLSQEAGGGAGGAGGEDRGQARQRARITNLSYVIDTAPLKDRAQLAQVLLVNDFHTVAAATVYLSGPSRHGADVVPLNPAGVPDPRGTLAVLGAGTGLGEAIVGRIEGGAPPYLILPSEGGHSDFAPRDEVEIGLLRFLQKQHSGHVSWERVLSGAGLLSLYEFLATRAEGRNDKDDKDGKDLGAMILRDRAEAPALISRHGLSGDDSLCAEALSRFVSLYGAKAGSLALTALAKGGVYLAGGIAAKILPKMQDGTFLAAFTAKGRLSALCQSIPVYVLTDPEVGLLGAAVLARDL